MGDLLYPQGQIAMGNGDLVDVTNVSVETTDNSKQVHTLRRRGAGITQGVEETTITFDACVSENGEEADWLQLVKKKIIKQLRVKIPNRTITCEGKYKDIKYDLPLDDKITASLTFIGHIVE